MQTRQTALLIALVIFLMACSTPSASLQISITTPNADAFTNATQNLQVTVSGGTPESVVVLKDGAPLATLSAPYSYAWDTTTETEGAHELVARATSGGTSVDSAPRTVTVDRTAPTLSAQTPSPNADNVPVQNPIQVVFSEPVRAGSLNDTSVVLEGAGSVNVAKTLSLGADGRTLSVQPVIAVAAPDTLSLRLTNGIKDRAGNPLGAVNWSWTLPGWLKLGDDPVISLTTQLPLNPSFQALDGSGNPVIATDQQTSPAGVLRRWTGSAWQAIPSPTEVVTSGGSFVTALAMDSGGNPVVTWQGYGADSNNRANQYVSRWDGSAWKMLGGALDVTPTLFPVAAAIALDSSDHPVVAWAETNSAAFQTPNFLWVKRWDGSRWVLLGGSLKVNAPWTVNQIRIALDSSGSPVVGWDEYYDFGRTITPYVKRWNATSASWESLGPAVISSGGTPSVAVRPNGDVLVAVADTSSPSYKIELRHWTGSVWDRLAEPLQVSQPAYTPSLALGTDGNPVVSWAEFTNHTSSLYTARLTAQGWVYLGGALTSGANENLANPSLKLDKNNIPTLAYNFYKQLTTGDFLIETRYRHLNQ